MRKCGWYLEPEIHLQFFYMFFFFFPPFFKIRNPNCNPRRMGAAERRAGMYWLVFPFCFFTPLPFKRSVGISSGGKRWLISLFTAPLVQQPDTEEPPTSPVFHFGFKMTQTTVMNDAFVNNPEASICEYSCDNQQSAITSLRVSVLFYSGQRYKTPPSGRPSSVWLLCMSWHADHISNGVICEEDMQCRVRPVYTTQANTNRHGLHFVFPRWHCCLWNEADSKHFLFVAL